MHSYRRFKCRYCSLSAGTGITLTSDNTQDLITIGTTATGCTGTVTEVCVQSGTTGSDFNVSVV